MACQAVKPDMDAFASSSFEDMLSQVQDGLATLAMVPVENSTAGRVADITIFCLSQVCILLASIFSE